MSIISLTKASDYEAQTVERAVERIFVLLELDKLLTPNMKVVLKPNLLIKRRPEEATTTHPMVLQAVVKALRVRGVQHITLADSPGGPYSKGALHSIYATCGMTKMAAEQGIFLNEDTSYQSVTNKDNQKAKSFNIITPVAEADLVISIGKLKTHCMTTLSGGVKNLFGCVPGLQKPELHYRFADKEDFCAMLVDLAQTLRPALTIMDAIVSMEGDGPSGGTPKNTGFLVASTDPFALDVLLSTIIGLKPTDVPTVRESVRRGLTVAETSAHTLVGDTEFAHPIAGYALPRSTSVDFSQNVPKFLHSFMELMQKRLAPRPVVQKKGCIGCGKCEESCPAGTIAMINKKAVIDYRKCISCYCCHEMCPVKTIKIKRTELFKL